jgi:hypothetical protein
MGLKIYKISLSRRVKGHALGKAGIGEGVSFSFPGPKSLSLGLSDKGTPSKEGRSLHIYSSFLPPIVVATRK